MNCNLFNSSTKKKKNSHHETSETERFERPLCVYNNTVIIMMFRNKKKY